jgi:hypothetical protein
MRFRSFPSFTALLLNVQYTIGYVAAGFLVSVPIQLLWTIYQSHSADKAPELWGSLVRGGVCLALYFVLWPILRYYDWGRMKLPEFKLFELSVTRNATLVSFGLLLLSLPYPQVGTRQMLWLLFLLEAVAYVKIKAHTLIFREFYAIERAVHRREWYDELRHGLRAQATNVGAELRGQAREVRGQLRASMRRLARWVGAGPAPEQPESTPRLEVIGPMPCRYQGLLVPGRIALYGLRPHTPETRIAPIPTSCDGDVNATLDQP